MTYLLSEAKQKETIAAYEATKRAVINQIENFNSKKYKYPGTKEELKHIIKGIINQVWTGLNNKKANPWFFSWTNKKDFFKALKELEEVAIATVDGRIIAIPTYKLKQSILK